MNGGAALRAAPAGHAGAAGHAGTVVHADFAADIGAAARAAGAAHAGAAVQNTMRWHFNARVPHLIVSSLNDALLHIAYCITFRHVFVRCSERGCAMTMVAPCMARHVPDGRPDR